MIGLHRKLGALPWPQRLLFGIPLILFFAWVAAKLSVTLWIGAASEADPEVNPIEYDSTFFRLNGDYGAENVRLTHYFPDGTEGPSYLADRVVIHTPGLFWFWMATIHSPKSIPDTLGITIENFRDAARTDETPGNYTNLPYDAIGCGTNLLTPADLQRMGFAKIRRDVTVSLQKIDGDTSKLHFELLTHGIGLLATDMDVSFARPSEWYTLLQSIMEAPIRKASLSMKDIGFIATRNHYCAKKNGISDSAFGAYHMQAMATRLNSEKVHFDSEALSRYRRFAEHGGELQIEATNTPKISVGQFVSMSRFQELRAFPSRIRYNNEPSLPFVVEAGAPIMAQVQTPGTDLPAQAVILPLTSHVQVAPGTTTAVPASTGVDAQALITIDYPHLEHMIGAHIQITTTNGTIRRGTLLAYSPYMTNLKLDAEDGGFNMTIPADTVVTIQQIPVDNTLGDSVVVPDA